MQLGIERPDPAYVSLTARPQRSVVFIAEVPGALWPATWAAALATQSTVWGGSANLLVPLYDGVVDAELLWALIELHDPDSCFVYAGTRADQEELDPGAYKAWRDSVDNQLSGLDPREQARQLDQMLSEPLGDWELPEVLGKEIVRRGAVFAGSGGLPPSRGPSGQRPPWPLISVLDLEPRAWEVIEPPLIADPVQRLLATAELGRFPKRTREAFLGPQSDVKTVSPSSRVDLIRWVYGSQPPPGLTPFQVSQTGCAWFRSGYREQPLITVVTGDDQWDFALVYALRRACGFAFWLPASLSWSATERECAIREIARVVSSVGMSLAVTSTTNVEAAEQVSVAISARIQGNVDVRSVSWREALPRHFNRLLTEESLGLENALALDQGRTQDLTTPIPAGVRTGKSWDLRWVTEISARGWNAVRHAALVDGPLLADNGDSRPSRRGAVYSSQQWFVQEAVPLIHQVRRPSLAPLSLLEQLRIAAAAGGWECRLSHKGELALAASTLFGGFEQLCTELRSADVARLLMGYLDGDRAAPGRALDQRRYLRLIDVADLGLDGDPAVLVTRLEGMRVFVRGVVLKCERCRYTSFYRTRQIDPSFACTRCSHQQRPGPAHWLGSAEPEWHYRLDEAVFQFLRQRGDLPMLAAYDLFVQSKEAVQIVPEVEFIRQPNENSQPCGQDHDGEQEENNPREFDFVVVRSGALYLGEGFAAARYEETKKAENERLEYLAKVAEDLNAQAVVLATAAEALDDRTRTAAESRFKRCPLPRLVVREAVSMPQRPPTLIDKRPKSG